MHTDNDKKEKPTQPVAVETPTPPQHMNPSEHPIPEKRSDSKKKQKKK